VTNVEAIPVFPAASGRRMNLRLRFPASELTGGWNYRLTRTLLKKMGLCIYLCVICDALLIRTGNLEFRTRLVGRNVIVVRAK
jgi:hypothetical protein